MHLPIGRPGRAKATGGAINSRRIFSLHAAARLEEKIAAFCDPGHIPSVRNGTRLNVALRDL